MNTTIRIPADAQSATRITLSVPAAQMKRRSISLAECWRVDVNGRHHSVSVPVTTMEFELPFGLLRIHGQPEIEYTSTELEQQKPILDACCGARSWWHNKKHPAAVYVDKRCGEYELCDGRVIKISPDVVADFRHLPFCDASFAQVLFDPPHLKRAGSKSWLAKRYGVLNPATWEADIAAGFAECWRVLAPYGTLVFKWSDVQIPLAQVLALFGHEPTITHTNHKTHFCIFFKTP